MNENKNYIIDPPPDTRFQPGQSGNPAGRPAGSRSFSKLLNEAIVKLADPELNAELNGLEVEQALILTALKKAIRGDYRFYKDIIDRLCGTPPKESELHPPESIRQVLEVHWEGGGLDISELSPEQKEELRGACETLKDKGTLRDPVDISKLTEEQKLQLIEISKKLRPYD